jgi:hypothetical protein
MPETLVQWTGPLLCHTQNIPSLRRQPL